MTQNTKILVGLIENEMQEQDFNQKELAKKAGISEPTLSRIFKLSRVPDINELFQICSVLRVRLSEVVAEAERLLAATPTTPPVTAVPLAASRSSPPPLPDEFINQLEKDLAANKYKLAARHHEQEDPTPEQ